MIACTMRADKNGKYFISVSLKILTIWRWTLKPPKDRIITDRIVLIFNGRASKLIYFKPCVISIIPFKLLWKTLFKLTLLSIIVVNTKHIVITPSINIRVLMLLTRELVNILPKESLLLILFWCIASIALTKLILLLSSLLG